MEHFDAVFKLDLTEETRTQLQEEEAIASSCLILAIRLWLSVNWSEQKNGSLKNVRTSGIINATVIE